MDSAQRKIFLANVRCLTISLYGRRIGYIPSQSDTSSITPFLYDMQPISLIIIVDYTSRQIYQYVPAVDATRLQHLYIHDESIFSKDVWLQLIGRSSETLVHLGLCADITFGSMSPSPEIPSSRLVLPKLKSYTCEARYDLRGGPALMVEKALAFDAPQLCNLVMSCDEPLLTQSLLLRYASSLRHFTVNDMEDLLSLDMVITKPSLISLSFSAGFVYCFDLALHGPRIDVEQLRINEIQSTDLVNLWQFIKNRISQLKVLDILRLLYYEQEEENDGTDSVTMFEEMSKRDIHCRIGRRVLCLCF